MNPEPVRITFGAFAPKPSDQVPLGKDADHIDRLADAIVLLRIAGIITDGDMHRARQRLMSRIGKVARRQERTRRTEPWEAEL